MNINNSIELARIEGEIDVIRALYDASLINAVECESRLGTSVGQFGALFRAGAVDSKFNYGLALSISNAVEDLNAKLCENRPDAEIFWTMRNEGKPGEDYPVVEDIIANSLKIQDDARINEIRKDKELRVMVEGWHTCVDDDGYSTYNAEIEFEIGEGANTIQEALALVEKFHKETVETNQNHYDGHDPLPGYYSPRLFTVYNPIGDPLFAGFWQYDKQAYVVPEPLTDDEYHELHDKKARLNKELPENQRADNYDTCRQIRDEIVQIELKLVTSDFWTTVNDFPGDAVIGDFTESVRKFNAQSVSVYVPSSSPVVHVVYEELSDSCFIEDSLDEAIKQMNFLTKVHESSGHNYEVSVYEVPDDDKVLSMDSRRLKEYLGQSGNAKLLFTNNEKLLSNAKENQNIHDVVTEYDNSGGASKTTAPTLQSAGIKELFQPITVMNEDTPASDIALLEEEVMEADSGIHERAHNRIRFN
ncbi:TPA: hypothetical protein QHV71_000526 [Enterobacter hormaechei subsp. steigerwaltii]|nr:hypothetical protein [Enterobacter hormaechei subsp. steigerwaltii]